MGFRFQRDVKIVLFLVTAEVRCKEGKLGNGWRHPGDKEDGGKQE